MPCLPSVAQSSTLCELASALLLNAALLVSVFDAGMRSQRKAVASWKEVKEHGLELQRCFTGFYYRFCSGFSMCSNQYLC